MKFLIVSALVFLIEPFEVLSQESSSSSAPPINSTCTLSKAEKVLRWDEFFVSGGPAAPSPPIVEFPFRSPGRGMAYRQNIWNNYSQSLKRPIMFENGQKWRLINCSAVKPPTLPERRGGCTSGTLAILSDLPKEPNSNTGKIGTLFPLTYPLPSPWAVYDLISFRLTPVIYDKSLVDKKITVEVFGWREDGSKTTTIRTKIIGQRYKIDLPTGGWNGIIQWQVRTFWTNDPVRVDFEFIIDDIAIAEHVYPADCDIKSPQGPPTPLQTLQFDDIQTQKDCKPPAIPLGPTYQNLDFPDAWKVTSKKCIPFVSPNVTTTTMVKSPPNALYIESSPKYRYTGFGSAKYLWDLESLWITIDSRGVSKLKDISITLQGRDGCQSGRSGGVFLSVTPTQWSFEIKIDPKDLNGRFRKIRTLDIDVSKNLDSSRVGFWLDDVVVRKWEKDWLPGCGRCGRYASGWCEYPVPFRAVLVR